jgi:hypothetical protein
MVDHLGCLRTKVNTTPFFITVRPHYRIPYNFSHFRAPPPGTRLGVYEVTAPIGEVIPFASCVQWWRRGRAVAKIVQNGEPILSMD